ncbi:MAG: hypothetical protein Q7S27_05215 [Nanoarchaeota archaeon]|nr:hypothetical protein [Nanoarchaeota archaeon]
MMKELKINSKGDLATLEGQVLGNCLRTLPISSEIILKEREKMKFYENLKNRAPKEANYYVKILD